MFAKIKPEHTRATLPPSQMDFVDLLELAKISEEDDSATAMQKLLSRPEIREYLPKLTDEEGALEALRSSNEKLISDLESKCKAERQAREEAEIKFNNSSERLSEMLHKMMEKQGQLNAAWMSRMEASREREQRILTQNEELKGRAKRQLEMMRSNKEHLQEHAKAIQQMKHPSAQQPGNPEKLASSLGILRRGHERAKELRDAVEQLASDRKQLAEECQILREANAELNNTIDQLTENEETSLMQIRLYSLEERNSKLIEKYREMVEHTKSALVTIQAGIGKAGDNGLLRESLRMHKETLGTQSNLMVQIDRLKGQLMSARERVLELKALEHRHVQHQSGHVQAMASLLELVHHKQLAISKMNSQMVPREMFEVTLKQLKGITEMTKGNAQALSAMRTLNRQLLRQVAQVHPMMARLKRGSAGVDVERLSEASAMCFQLMTTSKQTIDQLVHRMTLERGRAMATQAKLQERLKTMRCISEKSISAILRSSKRAQKDQLQRFKAFVAQVSSHMRQSQNRLLMVEAKRAEAQQRYRKELQSQSTALHRSQATLINLRDSLQTIASQRDIEDVERHMVKLQRDSQREKAKCVALRDRVQEAKKLLLATKVVTIQLQGVVIRQEQKQGQLQPVAEAYVHQSSRLKDLMQRYQEYIGRNHVPAITNLVQELYEECARMEGEYLELCQILHAKLEEDIGLNRGRLVTAEMVNAELNALQSFNKAVPSTDTMPAPAIDAPMEGGRRRRRRRSDAVPSM